MNIIVTIEASIKKIEAPFYGIVKGVVVCIIHSKVYLHDIITSTIKFLERFKIVSTYSSILYLKQ